MLTYINSLKIRRMWNLQHRCLRTLGFSRVARFPLLIGASLALGGYVTMLVLTDVEHTPEYYPTDLKATFLRRIPLNAVSEVLCSVANTYIPTFLRPTVFKLYATVFGCDLTEMKNVDLKSYATISEFFIRELADGLRPIDPSAALVSPADGQILHFGPVNPNAPVLEQVKGVNYSLGEFLGPSALTETDSSVTKQCVASSQTSLYQCVIYLGPGDCHRFFSPTDWLAKSRRHFPGKLISVHPHCASRFPGLYTLNERVVYLGQWPHGFMSFCAVAAVGVGAIRVQSDPSLITNHRKHHKVRARCRGSTVIPYDELVFPPPLDLRKGDEFGLFSFGSTIVLVFEAPSNVSWCIKSGDRIRIGEPLLRVPE